MKKHAGIVFLCLIIGIFSLQAQLPAFPGAEGFGKFSLGARAATNPTIYRVTNLNDTGSGSLRDAISQPNRIIVFNVSGIIKINGRLVFSSNLTVAGQTAPGDGISVYGNGVSFSGAKNVIVRHMRFRMGLKGDSGKDAAGIANGSDMIFDHCSFNWGLDETFSISWDNKGTEPGNITIQNSIIGQGIMSHSAGGLIQTNGGVTLYKNLYIDNKTRNPKVKGLNQYVNNVVYNWGSGGGYILGDTEASSWGDIRHNYFIKGPSTGGTSAFNRANQYFQVHEIGNYLDYDRDGILNGQPAQAADYGPVTLIADPSNFVGIPKAHPVIDNVLTAQAAYQWIVDSVGASIPARDEVDKYVVDELTSLGTKGTLINGEADLGLVNGVGNIFSATKQADTDLDGIPDVWEDANGLDKNNAADALIVHESGYLNIERYINSITKGQEFVKYPTTFSVRQIDEEFVILRWTNHAEVSTGIVLEYSTDNVDYTTKEVLSSEVSEFKVEGLTKSSTYYFRLKTVNGDMESLYTNSLKVVTTGADAPPAACTDPIPENEALISAFTQVTLQWSNPSAGTLYYNLYLGTSPDNLVQKTAGSTSSSYTTAIAPGVTYYWRVDAMNMLGIEAGELWSFTTGYRPPKEKVAYFSFDELSGTTAVNEIEGYASAVSFVPTWVAGKVNTAISMPGTPTDAAMVQPHYDAISLGNESFSVEMWFKSAGGSVDWYLIHKGSHAANSTSGSTGKWFGIQYNKTGSNDRLTWAIDDNVTKTDINVTPGSTYFDNQWHHLVTIRDLEQDQIRIYLDGVLKGSKTDGTADIAQTEHLVLGNTNNPNATPTNAFGGLIDEVSIYKGVLTDAEIAENYQKGLQTGLNAQNIQATYKAWPLPFNDELYVSSEDLTDARVTINIYDLAGQLLISREVSTINNAIHIKGLTELSSGSYLFEIKSLQSKVILKVIK